MSAINNPTNTFTISKTKTEIFDAVKNIATAEKYKYSVVMEDEILNRIRLREGSALSTNGYNTEFKLTKISENEYTVIIETSRERGGLDTQVEVNNANYILKEITDKFSSYLAGNINEKGVAKIPNTGTGCMVILGLLIIISTGIYFIL